MTCDFCRNSLDAYVDESCSPEELTGIEVHLNTCQACAAETLKRIQMKRAVRAAASSRFTPSPDFRLRVEKSIRQKRPSLRSFSLKPALAAFAVALFLVLVPVELWMAHTAREQAVSELLDMHVATMASANPVDVISTDRHTVKPWFQGKVPFSFNIPELQDSPYKLLGGKVVYFKHIPGAQLLFELRKHQLSVFIMQDRAGLIPLGLGETTVRQMAFNVESWSDAGLRYIVVSDTSPADVHGLSELLKSAAKQ